MDENKQSLIDAGLSLIGQGVGTWRTRKTEQQTLAQQQQLTLAQMQIDAQLKAEDQRRKQQMMILLPTIILLGGGMVIISKRRGK